MAAIFFALAFAAVSPGIVALQDADTRVAAIAWRLQTSNAGLCSKTVPLAGFAVQTLAQYEPAVRDAMTAQTGLGRRPAVQTVVAGGAGDRAGLKPGDVLTRINGWPTPSDLPPRASYEAIARTLAMIDNGLKTSPLMLETRRGRLVKTLRIIGVPGCASRVEIVTGRGLKALADGGIVQLSGGLVDFAANDDELAIVIAHELAHNILDHGPSRDIEQGPREAGRKAQLRKAEFEADRLGVWLIARAGYDLDAVVPLWMRLAQSTATGAPSDDTHPDWSERIDRAAAAVAEAKAQRAAGQPLMPTDLTLATDAQQSSSQAQFPR